MTNEIMSVKGKVEVGVRRFISDPKGPIEVNGEHGFYSPWTVEEAHNLITSAGRDFLHQQGYETTGLGTNGGNWIGLSSDSGAPVTTDTSLAGEITNLGLTRAQGTLSHTAGNTTTTVIKTFTASGTATAVQKCALFTSSSAGTMVHENTFSSVNLANNDQLQITWTITLS